MPCKKQQQQRANARLNELSRSGRYPARIDAYSEAELDAAE